MSYTRVNWENSPSTNTPIDATNLNKMDSGIATVDGNLSTLEGSLSTVATSGSYTDLSNKPTIPTNTSIVNLIYPVGSIYMSVNSTSPATLFGGTWERIKDKFMLSAGDTYSAGATGGSASHQITSAELPKHTHGLNSHTHTYAKPNANTNSHTLTVNEIPSHKHEGLTWIGADGQCITLNSGSASSGYNITFSGTHISGQERNIHTREAGGGQGHTHPIGTTSTNTGPATGNTTDGGFANNSFSTLPPYLAVYVWKRTA